MSFSSYLAARPFSLSARTIFSRNIRSTGANWANRAAVTRTSRLRVTPSSAGAAAMFRLAQTGTIGGFLASGMSQSSRASKRPAPSATTPTRRRPAISCTVLNPDAVTGLIPQLANADLGDTFSKTTYKITVRWLPVESVLLRGSYGTGFRAPAPNDIAGALTFNGSTAGSYTCPFPGSSGCIPGSAQYDLLVRPQRASPARPA